MRRRSSVLGWLLVGIVLTVAGCQAPCAHKEVVGLRAWVDVYEEVAPSTVCIFADLVGGGSIIEESGYIITNNHLLGVGEKNRQILQLYSDEWFGFRVIFGDQGLDMALIKIDVEGRTFPPMKLGHAGEMRVGEPVMAIGDPTGDGQSVSAGIVAGLGRSATSAYTTYVNMMMIDADTHPGNSGGPVINLDAELVGVDSAGAYDIGYAYPIDDVLRDLPGLLDAEIRYGFRLGMDVAGNSDDGLVTHVEPGTPAAEAGVQVGDQVVAVDGKRLARGVHFYLALIDRKGGDVLHLELLRDGSPVAATVVLEPVAARPAVAVEAMAEGIAFDFYEGQWQAVPDFTGLTPHHSGVTPTVNVEAYAGRDGFAIRFAGYIQVPEEGAYTFYLSSDDGSRLWIGDQLLVDNDGQHGVVTQRGFIRLAAGLHPITVGFFEAGGGESVKVEYDGPGFLRREIPASVLFHQ